MNDAENFLEAAYSRVIEHLMHVQAECVNLVRAAAVDAWTTQLQTMSNKIVGIDTTLPYLRQELVELLNADALTMIPTLLEYMTSIDTHEPTMMTTGGRGIGTTSSRAHHHAQQVALGNTQATIDSITKEIEFVNKLGFVLRPIVSGQVVVNRISPHAVWPDLSTKWPYNLKSCESLIAKFEDSILKKWFTHMKAEIMKTLGGVIEMSLKIPETRIETVFERRLDQFACLKDCSTMETDTMELIQSSVVAHAKYLAFYGALDELCKAWERHLAEILPDFMNEVFEPNAPKAETASSAPSNELSQMVQNMNLGFD
jgi:hypothetical protein